MLSKTLKRPTLVLNRSWQPVNITNVARALILLWNQVARVVDPHDYQQYDWADWSKLKPLEDEPFVQAVSLRLRIPEVITLVRFDRVPHAAVAFSRHNIFKRDRYTCQYCGCQPASDDLTIDHVVPRSRGGQSTWENCVLACMKCNHRKADRTPQEAHLRLKRAPARPVWHPAYSQVAVPVKSWSKFISQVYWNIELEE